MTSERLDVIAHRGWLEVPIPARLLNEREEVELYSNDGRWGLRACVVKVDGVSETRLRIALDRRTTRIFATPPVEDADDERDES